MSQPTRVEPGTRHALAWCTSCPPWRVLRADRSSALLAAADHLERVHQLTGAAANLREQARHVSRRHAEQQRNTTG